MSRDIRAGKAYVELGLRSKLDKGLQKASRKLKAFGTNAVAIGAGLAGSSAAILAPLLSAAANAQEVASKFDTVFGSNADMIRQWGSEFADQVGRSRVMIDEFLSSSQDLFVPLGFDSDSAEKMSKTITGLSIDLASFNNKADADVMNDLQAALTGSGEVMKKYGVILSEAAVKQELLNQSLDPKAATNAQKVQARLNIIMGGTTAAQGDALRTAGSFTNQTKRLRANLSNLAVTIGEHLIPPATFVVGLFNRVAKSVMNFAEQNKPLMKTIVMVAGGIGAAGLAIAAFGASAFSVGALIPIAGAAATAIGSLLSTLATFAAPIGIAVAAVSAIGLAVWVNREAIKQWAMAFWDALTPVRTSLAKIWAIVRKTFGGIVDAMGAGDFSGAAEILWTGIKVAFFTGVSEALTAFAFLQDTAAGYFNAIYDVARPIVAKIIKVVTSIPGSAAWAAAQIFQSFRGTFENLANVFGQAADWIMTKLGDLWDGFQTAIGGMAAALADGRVGLAADIMWASIQHAFEAGIAKVKTLWATFLFEIREQFISLAEVIVGPYRAAMNFILDKTESAMNFVRKKFQDVFGAVLPVIRAVAETFASAFDTALSAVREIVSTIQIAFDRLSKLLGLAGGLAKFGLEEVTGVDRTARQTRNEAAAEQRQREKLARARSFARELEAIQQRSNETRARRDALVAESADGPISVGSLKTDAEKTFAGLLNKTRNAASPFQPNDTTDGEAGPPSWWDEQVAKVNGIIDTAKEMAPQIMEGLKEFQAKQLEQGELAVRGPSGGETAGTFSALGAQLLGLGGNNAAEETARNTREIAQSMRRIEKKPPAKVACFE